MGFQNVTVQDKKGVFHFFETHPDKKTKMWTRVCFLAKKSSYVSSASSDVSENRHLAPTCALKACGAKQSTIPGLDGSGRMSRSGFD